MISNENLTAYVDVAGYRAIAGMFTLDSLIRTRTYRQRKAPNPLKPNPLLVGQKGDGIWGIGRNKTESRLRSPIR